MPLIPHSVLPQWSELLGRHFFNMDRSGQEVLLYVTTELLDELAKGTTLGGATGLVAVVTAPQIVTARGTRLAGHICKQALSVAEYWAGLPGKLDHEGKPKRYPLFLPYLAAFVAAVASRDDALGFTAHAYYPHLADFLKIPPAQSQLRFADMGELWQALAVWANETTQEQWGRFTVRQHGPRHVGLPLSQVVISQAERDRLPLLAEQAGIYPGESLSDERLMRILRLDERREPHILSIRTRRVLEPTARPDAVFLQQQLLTIVRSDFATWDGTIPEEKPDPIPTAVRPAFVGLRLFIHENTATGQVQATWRFRAGRELPDALIQLESNTGEQLVARALPGGKGWTTELQLESEALYNAASRDWRRSARLTDINQEFQATFRPAEVRLFRPADEVGLPADGWLETEELDRRGAFRLAVFTGAAEKLAKIRAWGENQCGRLRERPTTAGLPPGWTWFEGRQPRAGCPDVEGLILPQAVELMWEGGVKTGEPVNRYFAFALPRLRLRNAPTDAHVFLDGSQLLTTGSDETRYTLPALVARPEPYAVELRFGEQVLQSLVLRVGAGQLGKRVEVPYGRDAASELATITSTAPRTMGARLSAAVVAADTDFSRPFPTYLAQAGGIVFLGEQAQHVCQWPTDDLPTNWAPVWALIKLGVDDWQSVFCGKALTAPARATNPNRRHEWTVVNKRHVRPPILDAVRALWKQYQAADER